MQNPQSADSNPRVGMLATVRNRRGVITAVDPFDGGVSGRCHRVRVEFTDPDGEPDQELIWELEPRRRLVESVALPLVGGTSPMPPKEFDAIVRAARWSGLAPFIDPDGTSGAAVADPIIAPFHAAVQVEDFQLMPLVKALRMPRISLLLADDVGLGKTVEAGLVLSELLARRRIQRVLVLCPASLQTQWQDEMYDKFALDFTVVDRDSTHQLRRRLGMDANPWRSSPRIVASYHYFKQANVLSEFLAAFSIDARSGQLPWDLLIVDEAHNLSPAPFGEDSDLVRMLRLVAPKFEHRIFLSATPHNGHTRCFSGLLEMLDPVRFNRTDEFSPAERLRVEDVLVRRLKREINQRTNPPRFASRMPPEGIDLRFSPEERQLMAAFSAFRDKVRSVVATLKSGRVAGWFAVEILGKRLLSCPKTFSVSWAKLREGLDSAEFDADESEVLASKRGVEDDLDDDREAEGRQAVASSTIGAWLRPIRGALVDEIAGIDRALQRLGLPSDSAPSRDARLDALFAAVEARLRRNGDWMDDERMVIFTEYKTTLDYLVAAFEARYKSPERFLCLFGGMDAAVRDSVKDAFNDIRSKVRILLATDAASEGLNLQETARFVFHFDCPWNPSRLEQRNGRLDRHGQARDVSVFHFTSDDDADVRFLAHVIRKVDAIRDDLGSTGEIFDQAVRRRMVRGESVAEVSRDLDASVDTAKGRADVPRDNRVVADHANSAEEADRLKALSEELDLDPASLRETLEIAMATGTAGYTFEADGQPGRVRFRTPLPMQWEATIDATVRRPGRGREQGALPAMVFDSKALVVSVGGRPVFRPRRDTLLIHLSHPLFHRALATLARARFPGSDGNRASRWTVRRTQLPTGHQAHILLTVEELAINVLREPFHHWTRTIVLPVIDGALADPLPHVAAMALRLPPAACDPASVDLARDLWVEVERDVRRLLQKRAENLTSLVKDQQKIARGAAIKREQERFQSRQGEISSLIQRQSLKALEHEIGRLKSDRAQGHLFAQATQLDELDASIAAKEEELKRRRVHYDELREQLVIERDRVINRLIPSRYELRGDAQLFPIAVEIRLPEVTP